MAKNIETLLAVAAELRAVGRSWDSIAREVHRKAATCQQWPRRHKAEWDFVYRAARLRRFEETSNEAHGHLHNLLRSKDERIKIKAVEVWLKCGAGVYQNLGSAASWQDNLLDEDEARRDNRRREHEWARYRKRIDTVRAARGQPPLTNDEFSSERWRLRNPDNGRPRRRTIGPMAAGMAMALVAVAAGWLMSRTGVRDARPESPGAPTLQASFPLTDAARPRHANLTFRAAPEAEDEGKWAVAPAPAPGGSPPIAPTERGSVSVAPNSTWIFPACPGIHRADTGGNLMRLLTPFFMFAVPASILAQDVPHFSDAALRTIQFADENEGWAAGDDGVVWHTINGGKSWERQPTGTRASLRCVHFLNPYSGWAVGRVELPGGGSSGVVLATVDGGLEWKPMSGNSVPGLNVVKFFSERHGIAAGDGSEAFPSGMFQTIDGGRNWKLMPGVRNPSWLAADFSDTETGALAGAWNRIAPLRGGILGVADVDKLGGRNVTGLKLNGERAVAVGQGGLVMVSHDTAGVRWGFADLGLPQEVRANIDFDAVAVRGSHVWAVGRPGSVVFHSTDHGTTWEVQRTGQPLPLHAVYFHDENRGWAAGELGTILSTVDGGKTWIVQRQGGMRSAILFVHANARAVPLDTVAALGGDEGYLATAIGVTCPDPATLIRHYDTDAERIAAAMKAADPLRATDPQRLATAMRLAGGAAGEVMWQFPIAGFQEGIDAQAILDAWEKRHGEKAAVALLRQLVLALRVWRPDAIVADGPTDDTSKTINMVLRRAFEVAADPESFPEQIQVLGLQPWSGRKLFVALDKADPTAVKADTTSLLPRLGDSARGYAATAGRLWGDGYEVPGFRLVATRMKDAEGHTKFFDGIALAPGGAARREMPVLTEKDEAAQAALLRAHEKKRNVQAVIDGHAGAVANPEQALAQLSDAIRDLPASDGCKALYTAATSYAQAGRWGMAREAYLLQLDKFPGHPLSVEAARWLVRFQSSSEARRRFELGQFAELTESEVTWKDRADPRRVIPKAKTKERLPPESEIIQSTHRETLTGMVSARKWYEEALGFEGRLAAHGDLFARDVPTNLCWAAARRQLGKAEESQRWLLRYITETTVPVGAPTGARGADPWRECVLLESWLLNRAGQTVPPKPVAACRRTTKRPYLDGKLDDECWQNAVPMPLTTMAGDLGSEFGCKEAIEREFKEKGGKPTASAMQQALADGSRAAFSFDDENLYIAVVCRHPAGMKKDRVEKRTRDMDLRAFDRVSILIDLDRDYQTYYQLQVDQRGALAEDCWGDRSWDPKWFVAVNAEETGWTAEIAIPLSELTGDLVAPGKLWAVNVVRTVPGKGVQAWSGPAGVTPRPEGMGVLTFVGDKK